MIKAVIFDMDGLLTDSEGVGITVIQACGRAQGVEIPSEHVVATIGANRQWSASFYRGLYPTLDTERLFNDFEKEMNRLARAGQIPLKKGVKELLRRLAEGNIPRAVASSSDPVTIATYMEAAGIREYFSALVSASSLPSKPAPDVFLRAAEALHTPPESCLVLEDSVNGVKAGRAAGMTVCMIPDLIPYNEGLAPYCDHVLPDLAAVIPLVTA